MKPTIIVYNRIADELLEPLKEWAEVVKTTPEDPAFMEALPSAQVLLGSSLKVDEGLLEQAPNLKLVANMSVGFDNLDVEALTARGIQATNTPDVLTDTTADLIFGLLLSAARKIPELDRYMKDGKWRGKVPKELFGVDVHHKTLGLIGMGNIGRAIAERAHFGFKMDILYHNRSRNEAAEKELNARYESLEDLLQKSDFVCLMAPLTDKTRGMIGKEAFQLMKKSAIFINGARGQLVKEDELIEALQTGEIRAAGLDVYEKEPVDLASPLLKLPNIVTTPHLGSGTNETRTKMAVLAVENVLQSLRGETPQSLINPDVLKRSSP